MPQLKPSELPDKIRLLMLDFAGRPAQGVPVELRFHLRSSNFGERIVTCGLLASNHAGYLSFDLKPRKPGMFDVVTAASVVVPVGESIVIDISERLLQHRSKVELVPVTLPSRFDELRRGLAATPGIPSIESPDVDDWLLTPSSFGTNPLPSLGEGACETLLPSAAVERVIRFHHVRKLFDVEGGKGQLRSAPGLDLATPPAPWPLHVDFQLGEMRQYELAWYPLSHGLGKVLYSLTLAPCEAVRMAVVDWSRDESTERQDVAVASDDLTHRLKRDRTVEEVVNAVLREHQSGDSFMGGMAGVGGYGGGFGGGGMPSGGGAGGMPGGDQGAGAQSGGGGGSQSGQNWGVTGSHAVGYAMANSSGNREVDVETTQTLMDEIAQASHLVRDLRSTVVVKAGQREAEHVQTSIVRNHNHSHALTVLYYEVVRHYLLRSTFTRTVPLIFIRHPTLNFTPELASRHAPLLQRFLIDPRLSDAFALLEAAPERTDLDLLTLGSVRQFMVTISAADDEIGNRERLTLNVVSSAMDAPLRLTFPGGVIGRYSTVMTTVQVTTRALRYSDIVQLGLEYFVDGDLEWRERSSIQTFSIKAVVEHAGVSKLFDVLEHDGYYKYEHTSTLWKDPNRKVNVLALSGEAAARQARIDKLIQHINENAPYYSALVWLDENATVRAARLEKFIYQGSSLIDRIENRPVGAYGEFLAFRLLTDNVSATDAATLAERIVSMPTRGAFAEAQLSHCNASEVIDDTRFWDWQQSPCPDEATPISPVTLGSRNSALQVTPSQLGSAGVGVAAPPDAPEPFGMREVMGLLRTPDVFNNMSGIEQLGPLLQKLVEVAGDVEKARIGATTTLATAARPSTDGATEAARGGNTPAAVSDSAALESPQHAARQMAIANRAIERVEDPERRAALTEEAAARRVEAVSPPSARATSGTSRQVRLTFVFKDSRTVPVRGDYEVIVTNTQNPTQYRSSATASGGASTVSVSVPSAWRAVAITISVRAVNVVGAGDFARLQELFDGALSRLLGSTPATFPLETALELAVVDSDDPASTLFNCTFETRTREIQVEGSAQLQAQIEASVEPSVASVVRLGSVSGSVGGEVSGSVSTTFQLVSLTHGLQVRQGGNHAP